MFRTTGLICLALQEERFAEEGSKSLLIIYQQQQRHQQQQEQNWCIQLTNAHKDGWLPIKKQPPKSKPIHMYVCIYILLLL